MLAPLTFPLNSNLLWAPVNFDSADFIMPLLIPYSLQRAIQAKQFNTLCVPGTCNLILS